MGVTKLQAFAYALMSGGSAASGVTNLNRTGIRHTALPNFCKPLHKFCDHVAISIAFTFISCFLLATSAVQNVIWLSQHWIASSYSTLYVTNHLKIYIFHYLIVSILACMQDVLSGMCWRLCILLFNDPHLEGLWSVNVLYGNTIAISNLLFIQFYLLKILNLKYKARFIFIFHLNQFEHFHHNFLVIDVTKPLSLAWLSLWICWRSIVATSLSCWCCTFSIDIYFITSLLNASGILLGTFDNWAGLSLENLELAKAPILGGLILGRAWIRLDVWSKSSN